MDPPQCVQNAMMTKDKKPFTYTPGGIDLSEVRSPRMQRRIERNAHLGGAGEDPYRPQPPPPHHTGGPLPPSVEAVMRPQPQVQVFPSGPPPPPPSMARGGAPFPPPPPGGAPPPPPPPPSGPLPTQKVRTADNQVLERPDMTKIIPDNPMALLRKTSGPQPRRSLIDDMFTQQGKAAPAPTTPPSQQRAPQYEQEPPRYQPPERGAPISPVPQQYQPPPQQYQPPKQQYQPPPPQQRSPEAAPEQPRYQPPVIERQQTLPRQNNGQPEVKTSTAHLGSLYIPPAGQQQQQQAQRRVSPPTPPERNLDSPNLQTPPLREAPRPWQTKKPQQEEIPPWAKRENQIPVETEETQPVQQTVSPPSQPQQQRWPQSRPAQPQQPQYNQQQQQYNQQPQYKPQSPPQYNQQSPGGAPIRIEIRTNTRPAPYQQPSQEPEEMKPNAVYITQPIVLQHPGPRAQPQQQQQQQRQKQEQNRVDSHGARVIPIQVEGAKTPATPGNERNFNRQQSWSNNPTQSNSFKIIQKMTNTDDDEDDENTPVTEHAPRYPQNFQQPPAEQMRKMKVNEGDQNVANKFKQEMHFYDEENPRYRGGHIPSRVFKILDESVPLGPQPQGNKGPQVRTIPVQIEGDDPPQPYVHPSEQVVPEPKKYTGSSIPSRSFKILQAMTAPDNCANVDEQYEALPYEQWGYDPNYPSYPPPNYWHDYYYNYYYQEPQPGLSKEEHETSAKSNPRQTPTPRQTPAPRQTPVPFWGYAMSPYPYQTPRRQSTTDGESDAETSTNPRSTPSNGRSTPSPFWGYGYQQFPEPAEKACEEPQVYPYPPPYYDPYYYYYYGYPPMYPPYPYYGVNSDTDEMAGYSSTDEMAYYNRRAAEKGRNNRRSSSTPRTIVTPTINVKETVINNKADTQNPEIVEYTSDSASETETEEEVIKPQGNNPLRSIRSVSNIQVYAEEETNSHCSDDEVYIEECSEEANEDVDEEGSVYIVDDDAYPHQLSVIYEESERTDSRMRCASALSDSTTIAEKSDYEEDSPEVQNPSKPFKFCVSVGEENEDEVKTIVTVGDGEITTFEEKSSSATPRNETDTSDEEDDVQDEAETTEDEENDDTTPNEEIEEEEGKESDESEDWWGIIGKEDDLPKPRVVTLKREVSVKEMPQANAQNNVSDTSEEKKEEAVEQNSICSETTEPVIHDQTENQKTKIENNSVVVDQKPKNNYARAIKSVYDKIEDQFEEEENTGKLIELESFVARLEQMQKESGLWNIQIARNKSKSKLVKANSSKDINRKDTCDQTSQPEKGNKNMNYNDKVTDSCTAIKSDDINFKLITNDNNDSSASYSNYNSSKSAKLNGNYNESVKNEEITQQTADNDEENDETSDDTDSSSEDESEISQKEPTEDETAMQIQSIKQRIQALKESIRLKQSKLQGQEIKSTVKEKVNTLETTSQSRSKTTSTKSSVKSFEEYSEEEEGDSGVTSDMSRHISDTEEFPELKKLTRYQRAATHSRLFKLLQDECENAEDEDEVKVTLSEAEKQATKEKSVPKEEPPRRDQLSLPLRKTNESDSLCSSGVNSPGSPVNEKLVNELVQSLLKHKKGQMFRNMPKVKLYAAAAKILQEDLDLIAETPSDCSSFMSPLRDSTGYSTAAQTPQEFNGNYDEYRQYYETWNEAENYDILPSKAFKLLQEHSNLNKTGAVAGLLAKCPRVLSSKNIHKRLMKLLESSECPSPTPENPLESNEVTSAS